MRGLGWCLVLAACGGTVAPERPKAEAIDGHVEAGQWDEALAAAAVARQGDPKDAGIDRRYDLLVGQVASGQPDAEAYWAPLCRAEDARACERLGMIVSSKAPPSTPSEEKPVDPCELQDIVPCMEQSKRLIKEATSSAAQQQGIDGLLLMCRSGVGNACSLLGDFHFAHPEDKARHQKEAVELFRLGCALRDTHGCTALGKLTLTGTGVEASRAEAITLLSGSCEAKDEGACKALVSAYLTEPREAEDLESAKTLSKRLCAGGDAAMCAVADGL